MGYSHGQWLGHVKGVRHRGQRAPEEVPGGPAQAPGRDVSDPERHDRAPEDPAVAPAVGERAIRISPRTGKPVRKYESRTKAPAPLPSPPFLPDEALIRLRDVVRYTGIKATTIYKWMNEGRFPRPAARIGTRMVAWTWRTIRTWLEAQVAP
jgi:predicted DNA-binding transcriptional regulator AlpA